MATKDQARAEALRKWRALPADKREDESDASAQALLIEPSVPHWRGDGDSNSRYQTIKGWFWADLRGEYNE
jgi:hypothetical protein